MKGERGEREAVNLGHESSTKGRYAAVSALGIEETMEAISSRKIFTKATRAGMPGCP